MEHCILIVDDAKPHRSLIRRALIKAGINCPVLEAESLAEARKLLFADVSAAPRPTLAVIDLNLGMERGTLLVKELRCSATFSQIPIIVLSTSELESDIKESYQLGANCYLTKSQDADIFRQEIAKGVQFLLRS